MSCRSVHGDSVDDDVATIDDTTTTDVDARVASDSSDPFAASLILSPRIRLGTVGGGAEGFGRARQCTHVALAGWHVAREWH